MPRVETAMDDGDAVMLRVGAYLIERCEMSVARHVAADCDIYDFSRVLASERRKLADLRAGRPVNVYGWELPDEVRPRDAGRLYTVTCTRIIPALYERAAGTVP
jgi:hypothetical protein